MTGQVLDHGQPAGQSRARPRSCPADRDTPRTIEDLQSTTAPLQLLVLPPFFLSVYVASPGTLLTVLSYVPFTAPLSMPQLLLIGDAAWWEALVSAGIIAATTAALVVLASRLYRGSLLRTGSKTSLRAAWASGAQG